MNAAGFLSLFKVFLVMMRAEGDSSLKKLMIMPPNV